MNSSIEVLFILKEGNIKDYVSQIHAMLRKDGFDISTDDNYCLNDSEDEIYEPKQISDPQEVLNLITFHPYGGYLHYSLDDKKILIAFETVNNNCVRAITFSIFENDYIASKKRYDSLISSVSFGLNSIRTIQGIDLMDTLDWEDEVHRIDQDIYDGTYVLDIRHEKVISDYR